MLSSRMFSLPSVDNEEETEELFKPKGILNPITQRQCQVGIGIIFCSFLLRLTF